MLFIQGKIQIKLNNVLDRFDILDERFPCVICFACNLSVDKTLKNKKNFKDPDFSKFTLINIRSSSASENCTCFFCLKISDLRNRNLPNVKGLNARCTLKKSQDKNVKKKKKLLK